MQLTYTVSKTGVILRHKPGLLSKERKFEDWFGSAAGNQSFALSKLQSFVEDRPADASIEGLGVKLSHALVSQLDEPTALALGLPSSTRLALRLRAKDQIKSRDFRVQTAWVTAGGQPVRAAVDGAFISNGGKRYRLPAPLFDLLAAASALAEEVGEEERLAAYGRLVELYRTRIAPEGVDIDSYLDEVTVYHAAAFSLQLGVHDQAFNFDPVLFARDVASAAEDGETVDEEADALLPPAHQELFAKKWFRYYREARSTYPLKDGSLIVLDPQLANAMTAVRKLQDADEATRRDFITSPTRVLSSILGEDAEGVVERLFIETDQFSERVTGVDVWRAPVLPWVKPTPNSWIPESFGIRIGGTYVTLSPEGAIDAQKAIASAQADGLPSVQIRDANGAKVTVPVTAGAVEAVADIADLARVIVDSEDNQADASKSQIDEPPVQLQEKRFLTVHENHETVEYAALVELLDEGTSPPSSPDLSSMTSTLKPHQKEGVGWMWSALHVGLPGVLLADDMGLGKTLQVLALMLAASRQHREPSLIVAPTGLLANWRREISLHFADDAFPDVVEAFGPGLRALKKSGAAGHDTETGQDLLDSQLWSDADIVLTTYETMRDYHFSFAKTKFGVIAFDEIQKLKNPASQVSRAARSLNSRLSIGMTGTPVENKLQDLWSITDVLWPGKLGSSREFETTYPGHDAEKLEELRARLFDPRENGVQFAIRRMKADQLEGLPQKIEHAREVLMPGLQAEEYQRSVVRARAMKDGASPSDSMLRILHELRMISLHPVKPNPEQADLATYAAQSARLNETFGILERIQAKGEKALIFLENLEMQSFLASAIQKHFQLKERPFRIHGGVNGRDRQSYVNAFQSRPEGFDVMILSPKAGGVGLTLTAANHVIHLTRWWNPAVEDQSTDRVFRIGQEKDVHVYYPMAVHPSSAIRPSSFDLRLHALLQRKRALSSQMLAPSENAASDAAELFGGIVEGAPIEEVRTRGLETPIDEQARSNGAGDEVEQQPSANVRDPGAPASPAIGSTDAAEPSRDYVPVQGYYEVAEGEHPDLKKAFASVNGQAIKSILIEDPYALNTDVNRRCMSEFILELSKNFGPPKRVDLVFAPPRAVGGSDVDTEMDAHHKFKSLLTVMHSRAKIPLPQIGWRTRRRTQDMDFHDRFVHFQVLEDTEHTQLTYMLSGGVDRLMRPNFRVRVFLIPSAPI